MRLTTRGHYSVKALLDLMLNASERPISQREISERQHIPQPYLEQLLIKLRQAGLVSTVRGPKGGYHLKGVPSQITLGAVLRAVGDHQALSDKWRAEAEASTDWVTLALWRRLDFRLREALESITLEDLYHDARSHQAAQGKDSDFIV